MSIQTRSIDSIDGLAKGDVPAIPVKPYGLPPGSTSGKPQPPISGEAANYGASLIYPETVYGVIPKNFIFLP